MEQKVSKEFKSLIEASAAGDIMKVQAAIEAGADVNGTVKEDQTVVRGSRVNRIHAGHKPLHVAIHYSGSSECVRVLIEAGADVNGVAQVMVQDEMDGIRFIQERIFAEDTPLHVAARFGTDVAKNKRGNIECVRMLIEAGADVNALNTVNTDSPVNLDYGTPLYVAVSKNNIDCAKILIEAGADVNKVNYGNETPLYVAVRHNNIECVKLLLEAGANVNKVNPYYVTALMLAVCLNNMECLKMLIEAGADVNIIHGGNRSPLETAICHSNLKCIEMLLEAGADVNSATKNRSQYFCEGFKSNVTESIKCVQLLLAKGADVNIAGDFYTQAYESFLKKDKEGRKGRLLIVAAGGCAERQQIYTYHKYRTNLRGLSLKNECRESIRCHLLSINNINLFVRVQKLPLPAALKSYLLYDVTLDDNYFKADTIYGVCLKR